MWVWNVSFGWNWEIDTVFGEKCQKLTKTFTCFFKPMPISEGVS
jgi:hypothetical protein